jgi:hypothetical protein
VQTIIYKSNGWFTDTTDFRASLIFLNYEIDPERFKDQINEKNAENFIHRKGLINFSTEIFIPNSNRALVWKIFLDYDSEGIYDNICIQTSLKISTSNVVQNQSDLKSISVLTTTRKINEIYKTIFDVNTSLPILSCFIIMILVNLTFLFIIYFIIKFLILIYATISSIMNLIIKIFILIYDTISSIINLIIIRIFSIRSLFNPKIISLNYDIFLSYSDSDRRKAYKICERFRNYGLTVCIDEFGIDSYSNFQNKYDCINKSRIFISLISNNYINADNCIREFRLCCELNKRKILVMLTNIQLENSRIGMQAAGLERCKLYEDIGKFNELIQIIRGN